MYKSAQTKTTVTMSIQLFPMAACLFDHRSASARHPTASLRQRQQEVETNNGDLVGSKTRVDGVALWTAFGFSEPPTLKFETVDIHWYLTIVYTPNHVACNNIKYSLPCITSARHLQMTLIQNVWHAKYLCTCNSILQRMLCSDRTWSNNIKQSTWQKHWTSNDLKCI